MAERTLARRRRLAIWWHVYVEQRLESFGHPFSKRWHHRAARWLGRAIYLSRRWLQGARGVACCGVEDTEGGVHERGLDIDFGGACPVQGEGELDGRACYYRSRGEGWQFHVAAPGKDHDGIFHEDAWVYADRRYFFPDGGWVDANVSRACIQKAAALFRFHTRCREVLRG